MRLQILSLIVAFLLLAPISVLATQPTMQSNKLYLEPFYTNTFAGNTNYNFSVMVAPPDGISAIKSAIVAFNVQLSSVNVNFTLKSADGRNCKNPFYYIGSTYSSAGFSMMYFDCSNIITTAGNYTFTARSSTVLGSGSGWLDLTYMNNPQGALQIAGTEYYAGDKGTIFIQLKDSAGLPVSNGQCYLNIFYPYSYNISHPNFLTNAPMMVKDTNYGLYYYDLTVPPYLGVYMLSATCSYSLSNIFVYNPLDIDAPVRIPISGTYAGNTFSLNDWHGNLYTRCDSSGGSPKTCESYYEFNVSKVTNATAIDVYYAGESTVNALMTQYVYNWTSSSWVVLPNTMTYSASASSSGVSGVNDFLSNSVPINGVINGTGIIRIRLVTTSGSSFTKFDNWLSLKMLNALGIVQEIKGAGEMHVIVGKKYSATTLCGITREYPSEEGFVPSECARFIPDTEFNFPEGSMEDNITIIPHINENSFWAFETPIGTGCGSVYHVQKYNTTSLNYEDVLPSTVTYTSGSHGDNCKLTIAVALTIGEDTYWRIVMDNYMRYKLIQAKAILDTVNATFPVLCDPYALAYSYTYTVPILANTTVSTNDVLRACHRSKDINFWGNTFYTASLTLNDSGSYETIYKELIDYTIPTSIQYYDFLVGYVINSSVGTTAMLPSSIWSYPNRTLTDYNQTKMWEYLRETNATEHSIFSLINEVNNSIHTRINQVSIQIDSVNASIMNKLYLIQDDLQGITDDIAELSLLMDDINQTTMSKLYLIQNEINLLGVQIDAVNISIMNKLYGIQGEITSVNDTLIGYLMNITNITANITLHQEAIFDDIVALWGDQTAKPSYSAGFMGFLPSVSAQSDDTQYVCIDNYTLQSRKWIFLETPTYNKTYLKRIDLPCTYGCINNTCVMPNYTIFILLIVAIIAVYVLYRHFFM